MSALTDPIDPAHRLETSPIDARCVMRPSLPTMRLMRSSSRDIFSLVAITSLNVSAILPPIPVQSSGRRAEKSPRLNAVNAERSCFESTPSPFRRKPLCLSRRSAEGLFFFIEEDDQWIACFGYPIDRPEISIPRSTADGKLNRIHRTKV